MSKITLDDINIFEATDKQGFKDATLLFEEYANTLNVDLSFQDFEKELQTIDQQYRRPKGALILAKYGEKELVGCVSIRGIEQDIAELKRMYLRKDFRGLGLGQIFIDKALATAKELGYNKIRLDTLPAMEEAQSLYLKNGFYEITPYRYNPVKGAKYLEKVL